MKRIISILILLIILFGMNSCYTWKFYTKDCDNPKPPSYNQAKWQALNDSLVHKFYCAKIKGGSKYFVIIKSRKKDKEELKQLICDYWK